MKRFFYAIKMLSFFHLSILFLFSERTPVLVTKPVSLSEIIHRLDLNSSWNEATHVLSLQLKQAQTPSVLLMPYSRMFIVDSKICYLEDPLCYSEGQLMFPISVQLLINRIFHIQSDYENKKKNGQIPKDQIKKRHFDTERTRHSSYKKITIMIDPGHGGKDRGAKGCGGLQEKDLVLKASILLKDYLNQMGFNAIMTRDKDVYLSLNQRVEMANRKKVDMFVSIHANSSPQGKAKGLEIYSLSNSVNHRKRVLSMKKERMTPFFHFIPPLKNENRTFQILTELTLNQNRRSSREFSKNVLNTIKNATFQVDRGMKKSRFYVLRYTNAPSILIELGFITHPKECQFLKTSLPLITKAIARGISKYMRQYVFCGFPIL